MIAVYPGSFDPLTLGHLDIIKRACKICDKLYIAIGKNSSKASLFTDDEKLEMINEALSELELANKVEVEIFSGLLAEYAKQKEAKAIIRGLRVVSDFDYEFQIALSNRMLNSSCETIFLLPSSKYIFLSSTIVRDIAKNNGDISSLVPKNIEAHLKAKFQTK